MEVKMATRRKGLRPVKESSIQVSMARLFEMALPTRVMFWHTPNGEKRDAVTAARLKAMGVTAGVPDFLLYDTSTGYLYCIEVKGEKGHLSDAQRGWKSLFDRSPTGRYAVARSLDEAMQVISEWWPDCRLAQVPGRAA